VAWAYAPSALRTAATDVGAKCVECHPIVTPNVVNDWKLSEHSGRGIGCDSCHGSRHLTAADAAKAKLPTAETCEQCHADRLEQVKRCKHAPAWAAMEAMATIHYQPLAMTEAIKGCGGFHKIGLKSPEQVAELAKSRVRIGNAACDSCHHAAHVLNRRSKLTAGVQDVPHGIRPPAVGDVFVVEAWRAGRINADEDQERSRGRRSATKC
jgi:ssDNA-binding Zn-finger/Zn-ribbon topoisomerase 1